MPRAKQPKRRAASVKSSSSVIVPDPVVMPAKRKRTQKRSPTALNITEKPTSQHQPSLAELVNPPAQQTQASTSTMRNPSLVIPPMPCSSSTVMNTVVHPVNTSLLQDNTSMPVPLNYNLDSQREGTTPITFSSAIISNILSRLVQKTAGRPFSVKPNRNKVNTQTVSVGDTATLVCVEAKRANSNTNVFTVDKNMLQTSVINDQQVVNLPTPVKLVMLSKYLELYDPELREFLINGFTKGFKLGANGENISFLTCKNHQSALDKPEIVTEKK
ncbi:Hypothetical predicted protein [Mytilus galloprovincialis]|uniref:Uncharacterized protein n=1 Tax=Mytilus galloprovincialis TaxID=29158 RepID=A0A8B6ETT2_MYTGA|nr:Hypothetical predicted protein [Mytilus galloprovincialis]